MSRQITTGNRHRFTNTRLLNTNNPLIMLIILQAMFFILLNFIKSIYVFSSIREEIFYTNIYHWFILPADPITLIKRPWTVLTMPFSELKMMIVIGNLIWLWTFGHLIQDLIGGDKLFPIYLYGAFSGAFVFVVVSNLIPGAAPAISFFSGIASSIMGLALAATSIAPQYRFFPFIGGGIPLWVITLVYALLKLSATSGQIADLFSLFAGAASGYVFIFYLKRGIDLGKWMNALAHRMENVFGPSETQKRDRSVITQKHVDLILDKISQQGFEKLTEEEKRILEKASKQDL